ncbi:MAG: LysM peptidoglycan-binding domain-containing protein, partial [Muribaculaceae bacterium]|nr:LysM peptidoglycan-binding domain-containing protein [Muribaculaceae bacterium]
DDNIKIGQNLKVPGTAGKPQQAAKQHNVADNDNDKKREAEAAAKKKKEAAEAKKKREEEERRRREAAKPIVHEVKEGQNLTKLAQQYGTTPEAIRKANNIKGDNIVIGQKINIPKGGKNAHAQQHDNDEQHHQHKSSKNTKQVVKNTNNSTVQPSNGRKRRK